MSGFEFVVENDKAFQAALDKLAKQTSDFRIPLRIIASDFYRSQKIIFKLKSPGLYPPLGGFNPNRVVAGLQTSRERAETMKEKRVGFAYPLLVGERSNIKDSTLSRSHKNSVFFLNRKNLTLGTNVSYGKFHQSDGPRTVLPQRKFIFIDGGPRDASKSSGITGRRERWINIVETHINQLLLGSI